MKTTSKCMLLAFSLLSFAINSSSNETIRVAAEESTSVRFT